jgi:hypothetical protein
MLQKLHLNKLKQLIIELFFCSFPDPFSILLNVTVALTSDRTAGY